MLPKPAVARPVPSNGWVRGVVPLQAQPLPRGRQRSGPVLHGAGKFASRDGRRGRALGTAVQRHV